VILVDTSVWVAHLRDPGGDPSLIAGLESGVVAADEFVAGELALAGAPVTVLFGGVEIVRASPHEEVMDFVARLPRPVRGVGWIDVHLVHAALIRRYGLLSRDTRQRALFESLRRR